MLFTPSGTFYSKIQFKTEDEVEKVAVDNFELLFGDYSILLPKSLIRTSGGKGGGPGIAETRISAGCFHFEGYR
jgi:hypothetical protein